MTAKEKQKLLNTLTKEMQAASRALEFEKAAELRDVIFELQNEKNSKKKNTPSQTA
jgi:excinuclease ABC subunit B